MNSSIWQIHNSTDTIRTYIMNMPPTSPWRPLLKLCLSDCGLDPITGAPLLTNSELIYGIMLVDLFLFVFTYEELMQIYGIHFLRPSLVELATLVYNDYDSRSISSWANFKYDYFAVYNKYVLNTMETALESLIERGDYVSCNDFCRAITFSDNYRIALTAILFQTTFSGLYAWPLMLGDIVVFVTHSWLIRSIWTEAALWEQMQQAFDEAAFWGQELDLTTYPAVEVAFQNQDFDVMKQLGIEVIPQKQETEAVESLVEEPVAIEPLAKEPVAIEPLAKEPVAIEPLAKEPVAIEPLVTKPMTLEPLIKEFTPIKQEFGAIGPQTISQKPDVNITEQISVETVPRESDITEQISTKTITQKQEAAEQISTKTVTQKQETVEQTVTKTVFQKQDVIEQTTTKTVTQKQETVEQTVIKTVPQN